MSCLLFFAAHYGAHPFSCSYGPFLLSSLTMLPRRPRILPHPPVSVYGTGTIYTIAAFSPQSIQKPVTLFRSMYTATEIWICLHSPPSCTGSSFHPHFPSVSPHLIYRSTGISTCCPFKALDPP